MQEASGQNFIVPLFSNSHDTQSPSQYIHPGNPEALSPSEAAPEQIPIPGAVTAIEAILYPSLVKS